MKKLLFIGAYGIENAGDDLPMLVMIENLKKLSPTTEFEFHALTRHLNPWDEKRYGVIYHKNLEYENREEAKGKWFRGLNYDDDREIITRLISLIKSMDLLIIGAGNFIIDISLDLFKGPIPLMWWYIHLAKLYDKKVFLYGISTAPLMHEYSQLLTKEIVMKSDIVTARDQASKQYLESLNIEKKIKVLPDPTLAYHPNIEQATRSKRDQNRKLTIGLGLRRLDFLEHKGQKVFEAIIAYINSEPNNHYIFIPQSTYIEDNDIDLAKSICKAIDKDVQVSVIETRKTPQELIEIYSACDATISIRLHSAVFSQIAGTPAIAINYLPKVKAYMEDFETSKQLLSAEHISAREIGSLVDFVSNNEKLKTQINEKNIKLQKKTITYAELALSLLNGSNHE